MLISCKALSTCAGQITLTYVIPPLIDTRLFFKNCMESTVNGKFWGFCNLIPDSNRLKRPSENPDFTKTFLGEKTLQFGEAKVFTVFYDSIIFETHRHALNLQCNAIKFSTP